jgi:hypothetical protein
MYNFLRHPMILTGILSGLIMGIYFILLAYKLVPFYEQTTIIIILLSGVLGNLMFSEKVIPK